jgi:multisubunit Na+/H+ antiporter MnhF subunit
MSLSNMGDKIQALIMGIIAAVILLVIGVALGPTVTDAAAAINVTSMASVPLGTVITLLATYIGFFYYLAIVLGMLTAIWASVRYS